MPMAAWKLTNLVWLILAVTATSFAQDSATPTATPLPTDSPAAIPLVTPLATTAPTRNVRVSFVPPPLEGTISLGVYDSTGKLVRVLHEQESFDAFTVGADALQTRWDGKDDNDQDLPPGKYHARGYVVGPLQL